MKIKKALIIASHPDDDILGCGGIFSKFKGIIDFRVIFIAEGSTARFEKNDLDCEEVRSQIKKRTQYGIESLKYLGIFNYKFYNLPCGRLDQFPLIEINKIIEKEINSFKPDTVFTHSDCDSNKDHSKVYDSSIIATRPGSGVKNLISYEVLSSTEWGFSKTFSPNLFFQLSKEDVNNKWEALKFYKSETKPFPYPRSKKGIETLSNYRGLQSGNEYAEAFKLIRGNI
jgi:LmbE family N-acetylglucosaminyl deacetylase